jgi:hypothetical protein
MESGKVDTRSSGNAKATGSRRTSPASISRIGMGEMTPIEWMDGFSWRLPSGKALAEFALEAGFLAPLMFRTPFQTPKAGKPAKPGSKKK